VAEQHPKVAENLRRAYEAWFKDVTAKGIERMPIPVGYARAPVVEMPAPECYMNGNVRYMGKGGHGWANDWITGWQSTDDYVWWDINVVAGGRHEVTLMYTCGQQDIGSRIRVAVGGSSVEGVVEQAHDPEPIVSPDRAPRVSVYEKIWAPLTLGTLELDKGRARLTVKALSKPGRQVFDLKAVRLRRVD
jgi:arylsulfatase A